MWGKKVKLPDFKNCGVVRKIAVELRKIAVELRLPFSPKRPLYDLRKLNYGPNSELSDSFRIFPVFKSELVGPVCFKSLLLSSDSSREAMCNWNLAVWGWTQGPIHAQLLHRLLEFVWNPANGVWSVFPPACVHGYGPSVLALHEEVKDGL